MTYATKQEQAWVGQFGSEYIGRNISASYLASNFAFFSQVLARSDAIGSVLELGSNVGINLRALRSLLPEAHLNAVEINPDAAEQLRQWGEAEVHEGSILDFRPATKVDLAFTKGVLIHINPDRLAEVYSTLAAATSRYVLIAEYYNPTPVSIEYRGESDLLFKRDFASEFLDAYPEFAVRDYGFAWHRDPNFPQDDITWFLLEKVL